MRIYIFLILSLVTTICFANPLQGNYICDTKYGPVGIELNELGQNSVGAKIKIQVPGPFGKLERILEGTWDYSNDTKSASGLLTAVSTKATYELKSAVGIAKLDGEKLKLTSTGSVSFNSGVGFGGVIQTVTCVLK